MLAKPRRRDPSPLLLAVPVLAAAMLTVPVTGALLTAATANTTNTIASSQLYSPTGLGGSWNTNTVTLSWTAAQPNSNGNGNGYAISGVANGASSTCPAAAASYTTFVGSATGVTYTDSSSSLLGGAAGTYICYLVQTGYSPSGPPWASAPTWTSGDTLPTIAVQIPSPPTITASAVCDRDGNPVYPATGDWVHQAGTFIVYANVTGTGISSVSASLAPTAGGSTLTATLSAGSGTCAGTAYAYTSGSTAAWASQSAGTNNAWLDVAATNAGGTTHSNGSHTGDVSVDNTVPASPAGLGHGTGPAGTGLLVFNWNASTAGISGMAGYDVEVYLQNSTTKASQYPNGISVATTAGSCTYTNPSGGQSTIGAPCAILNLTSGTKYDLKVAGVSNSGMKSALQSQGGVSAP